MNKIKIGFLLTALALPGISYDTKAETMRVGPSVAISFEAGKAALTIDSKAQLNTLVQDARASGKIDEVQIAAWSDNPIPADKKQLSKADRKLAQRRAKALQDYLKKPLNVPSVVVHNMAERSTWLGRMFGTNDAELKSEITRGPNAPMSQEEFRVFRDNGKPKTAVVLAIVKD